MKNANNEEGSEPLCSEKTMLLFLSPCRMTFLVELQLTFKRVLNCTVLQTVSKVRLYIDEVDECLDCMRITWDRIWDETVKSLAAKRDWFKS